MANNLWSTSYVYAPGVPNPSSPPPPSSMSSSSSDNLLAAATTGAAPTPAPTIPQHWRRVTTICTVDSLDGPALPGQEVSDTDLLSWLCQLLGGELRQGGQHAGTPPLDLLVKAINSLPATERDEFFKGLRNLKK